MDAAREYLLVNAGYFWCYEDQGTVIAVPNGRTIGYTEQIVRQFVCNLAPQGLPRFSSLLLALASTSAHGKEIQQDIAKIVSISSSSINEANAFLELLTQVPDEFKVGEGRILLLQAIFQRSHYSVNLKNSFRIREEILTSDSIAEDTANWIYSSLSAKGFNREVAKDFKVLALIGREFPTVQSILDRIAGAPPMPQLPIAVEPETKPPSPTGSLVEQLTANSETFPIGALIPRLIGGLQISFHASLPSEQPLGGVADITNKGSFDKLLTSEFALEDHVLMSRLANSEALYKHREVPPADNVFPRIILIDTTLKNWGNIRAVSFAVALAITEHPNNEQACRVFLVGKSYREVSVSTVTDVIEALKSPDPTLDPGVGIEALFTDNDLRNSELFFVGTADSVDMAGMQRLAGNPQRHIDHWIHPDEAGKIRVYKNPKRGKRLVQEILLPLGELWRKDRGRRSKREEINSDAPTMYPILFPNKKMRVIWHDGEYAYGQSGNSLLRMYDGIDTRNHGWELISNRLYPVFTLKAVMTHDDLTVTVLMATDDDKFHVVRYPGRRITVVEPHRLLKSKYEFYVDGDQFKGDYNHGNIPCIDLDGKVSLQENKLISNPNRLPIRVKTTNFISQLRLVGITIENQLRIRKHDLLLEQGDVLLRHQQNRTVGMKIAATENASNMYVFPDGSYVLFNTNGLLTLHSSNPDLRDIHLPARLDVPLGMATREMYAGDLYYRQQQRIELLVTPNINMTNTLTALINKNLNNVNLKRAEQMARTGLIVCHNEETLAKLEAGLDGFSYKVRRRGLPQWVVPPRKFYNQHISPFIQHIVRHGTNA